MRTGPGDAGRPPRCLARALPVARRQILRVGRNADACSCRVRAAMLRLGRPWLLQPDICSACSPRCCARPRVSRSCARSQPPSPESTSAGTRTASTARRRNRLPISLAECGGARSSAPRLRAAAPAASSGRTGERPMHDRGSNRGVLARRQRPRPKAGRRRRCPGAQGSEAAVEQVLGSSGQPPSPRPSQGPAAAARAGTVGLVPAAATAAAVPPRPRTPTSAPAARASRARSEAGRRTR